MGAQTSQGSRTYTLGALPHLLAPFLLKGNCRPEHTIFLPIQRSLDKKSFGAMESVQFKRYWDHTFLNRCSNKFLAVDD